MALHVDSEVRRSRDHVRVVIVATAEAANVAEAAEGHNDIAADAPKRR